MYSRGEIKLCAFGDCSGKRTGELGCSVSSAVVGKPFCSTECYDV